MDSIVQAISVENDRDEDIIRLETFLDGDKLFAMLTLEPYKPIRGAKVMATIHR